MSVHESKDAEIADLRGYIEGCSSWFCPESKPLAKPKGLFTLTYRIRFSKSNFK